VKTVLITGASSGFGKQVALRLLDEGYIVYGTARRVEKMRDIGERGGHVLEMDVTDTAAVNAGVNRIITEQGRIDVLFNNAGYGSYGIIECVPLDEIKYQYDVNVFGMARMIQAVLPHMRAQRSGRIINTASVVGHVSMAVLGWYASTKYAVEALTDALRMEVKRLGIDVVLIEPGAVKTGFDDVAFAALAKTDCPDDYRALVSAFKRFGQAMYAKCPGPESTVKAVLKAIKARRPKIRYATTTDAWILPKVRRLLGARLFDWAILRRLR
jgi:NADP-dependent 3-hydroxy acid dehydrogenase YdfG